MLASFLAIFLALQVRPVVLDGWDSFEDDSQVNSNLSITKPPTCGVSISGPFYTDMVLTE